jgi:hypothetical protein
MGVRRNRLMESVLEKIWPNAGEIVTSGACSMSAHACSEKRRVETAEY